MGFLAGPPTDFLRTPVGLFTGPPTDLLREPTVFRRIRWDSEILGSGLHLFLVPQPPCVLALVGGEERELVEARKVHGEERHERGKTSVEQAGVKWL